ncbi:hypothetical protein DFP72DRAFT_857805 [Ephemerocybe angulata]|uniref:Uncharacterized protein n=1 Tax=Ephemerocybe angulata TaxID=980116 RepID=A0A8H6HDL9_9AGAR|nr:hypothetical protein DFP72DRAFT_857805 [Tulosesus angulatus]
MIIPSSKPSWTILLLEAQIVQSDSQPGRTPAVHTIEDRAQQHRICLCAGKDQNKEKLASQREPHDRGERDAARLASSLDPLQRCRVATCIVMDARGGKPASYAYVLGSRWKNNRTGGQGRKGPEDTRIRGKIVAFLDTGRLEGQGGSIEGLDVEGSRAMNIAGGGGWERPVHFLWLTSARRFAHPGLLGCSFCTKTRGHAIFVVHKVKTLAFVIGPPALFLAPATTPSSPSSLSTSRSCLDLAFYLRCRSSYSMDERSRAFSAQCSIFFSELEILHRMISNEQMTTTSQPQAEDSCSPAALPEPEVDGGWEYFRNGDDYCLREGDMVSTPAIAAPLSDVQPIESITSVVSEKKVRFADEIEENHKAVHFSDWDEYIVYILTTPPMLQCAFSAFDVELVFESEPYSEEQVSHCEPDDLDLIEDWGCDGFNGGSEEDK